MANKLYNILVPVDFTAKNKWAITKAIEISNSFNCNIHLVYVSDTNNSLFMRNPNMESALKKLEQLKDYYHAQLCGEGKMEISALQGNQKKQLVNYIQQYEMDLIVTGLSRFNFIHRIISSVSISRLAKKTNIPVLAIRPGGLVCHFKKIVLPVSGEIPMRQIRFAALLGRAFKSRVYFVSLRINADDKFQSIIDGALEMVQSISTVPAQWFFAGRKKSCKKHISFF